MKWIVADKDGKETEYDDANGFMIDTTEVAEYVRKAGGRVVRNIPPEPIAPDITGLLAETDQDSD